MDELIRVKLDVDGIRHSIVHAFTARQLEIAEALNEEIDRVIESYDFRAHVRSVAENVLNESVKHAVEDALRDYTTGKEMRGVLVNCLKDRSD